MRGPRPPAHLSAEAQAWWRSVVRDYELPPHGLRLLRLACEAMDTSERARAVLAEEGLTTTDRHGQIKAHPCCAVQRESAASYMRALRQLGLDDADVVAARPVKVTHAR